MRIEFIHTDHRDHSETADGARHRRPLARFLAMSLVAHLCLLAGFKQSPLIATNRYLGQPVLDVQLQDHARAPAPAASLKTAVQSPSTTKTSNTHTVVAPTETIARFFPSASAAETDIASREPMTTAETETGLRNQLLGELQTRLSHYLTYPPLARQRGWEGTVLLGLRVASDGYLQEIRVQRSSGYAVLDHSALNSLVRLGHLADVSPWLNGHGMDMQLPVIYRLVEN